MMRLTISQDAKERPEQPKCCPTELQQAISELALEGIGYYSMPFVRDTFALSNEEVVGPDYAPPVAPYYFSLRKASIYAGSNEIQGREGHGVEKIPPVDVEMVLDA